MRWSSVKTEAARGCDEETARLAAIANALPASARRSLLEFAEFLATRHAAERAGPLPAPKALARPERESVVAAMQRLAEQYDMLERDTLLSAAADLMSQHVLQGRAAAAVIDDLETLFSERYAALKAQENPSS